ncbi:TadE/TadG family type IV pilus assembly protein [Bacillaceae bacterium IKA-2]|nr:TadE/TadG family type IV pilus assembly protein [Bacillaceae bacterium IKA-2]
MKSEKGQAVVEFALVFMLLALIFSGIVDFGRTFHAYLALDHAGRESARVASLGSTDLNIKEVAKNAARQLTIKDTDITIIPIKANRTSGVYATVTLTYNITFITPLIGKLFDDNQLTLESKTVMRVE